MPSSRLKTAFVMDDLGFGGAQRQLSILVEALRRRAGEEGPALVRANYSVDAAVDKLMPVYQKVVGR